MNHVQLIHQGKLAVTNQEINKQFFSVTDAKTTDEVLSAVASHYRISKTEAFAEITDENAEHLLEYLTGTVRDAISVLMRKHDLAAN